MPDGERFDLERREAALKWRTDRGVFPIASQHDKMNL